MACMYQCTNPWMAQMPYFNSNQGQDPGKYFERGMELAHKLEKRELRKQIKKELEDSKKPKESKKEKTFTMTEVLVILMATSWIIGPAIEALQNGLRAAGTH